MEIKTPFTDMLKAGGRYVEHHLTKEDIFNINQNELFNKIKKTISLELFDNAHGISVSGELQSLETNPNYDKSGQLNRMYGIELFPYGSEVDFAHSLWYLTPENTLAEVRRIVSRKIANTFDKGIFTGTDGFHNVFEVVNNTVDLAQSGKVTLSDVSKLITETKKKTGNLSLVVNPDTLEEALKNVDATSILETSMADSIIHNNNVSNVDIVISNYIPDKKILCGDLSEMELHIFDKVDFYKKDTPGTVKHSWEMSMSLAGTVNTPDSFIILK